MPPSPGNPVTYKNGNSPCQTRRLLPTLLYALRPLSSTIYRHNYVICKQFARGNRNQKEDCTKKYSTTLHYTDDSHHDVSNEWATSQEMCLSHRLRRPAKLKLRTTKDMKLRNQSRRNTSCFCFISWYIVQF